MIRAFALIALLIGGAGVYAESPSDTSEFELVEDPFALPPDGPDEAQPLVAAPPESLAPQEVPPATEPESAPQQTAIAAPTQTEPPPTPEPPKALAQPEQAAPLPAPTFSSPTVTLDATQIKPLNPWDNHTAAHGYQVVPNGNNLELVTPHGRRFLFGDIGLINRKDYKIEIPLDALRPPEDAARPTNQTKNETTPPALEPQAPVAQDRSPQSLAPPRVVVEHDFSDRLILEANRLFNRGKYYEATIAVDQALSKRPDLARAWIMKGSLLFVQGYRDLAKGAWEKAIALEPQNQEVLHYLRRVQ